MRRPRSKLEVSTFPFLAVLLCAMGALLLLLFIMDRRAKIAAQHTAAEVIAERQKRTQAEEEARQAEWQKAKDLLHQTLAEQHGHLLADATQVQSGLDAAGQKIAGVLSQNLDLKGKMDRESAQIAALQMQIASQRAGLKDADLKDKKTKADLLEAAKELAELELALKQLRALKANEKQVYSVVPYRGKRGDARTPIYVECVRGAVIFHPEKKSLDGLDFTPDSLKAEVERRTGTLNTEKTAREKSRTIAEERKGPYVLFLVRPTGIETYYKAQAGLKGYDLDFGYEMVDEDWVLDFNGDPNARPALPIQFAKSGEPKKSGVVPFNSAGGNAGSGGSSGSVGGSNTGATRGPMSIANGLGSGSTGSGAAFSPDGGNAGGGRAPGGGGFGPAKSEGGFGAAPFGSGGQGQGSVGIGSPPASGQSSVAQSLPMTPLGGGGQGQGNAGGSSQTSGQTTVGQGLPRAAPTLGNPSLGGGEPGGPGKGASFVPISKLPSSVPPVASSGVVNPIPGGNTQTENGGPSLAPIGIPAPGQNVGGKAGGNANPNPGGNSSANTSGESEGGESRGKPLPSPPTFGMENAKKPAPPPPPFSKMFGNRDFIITIDCYTEHATMFPSGLQFRWNGPNASANDQALVQAVTNLIARRQASVRPGEPPYRPIIRFQVSPDGLRTFLHIYPLLSPLNVTMTRENVQE